MSKRKATAQLVSAGFGNNERWYVIVRLANGTSTPTYRTQDGWSSLRIKDIPKFLYFQIDELWIEADKRNDEFEAKQRAEREAREAEKRAKQKFARDIVESFYDRLTDKADPGGMHGDVLPLNLPYDWFEDIINDLYYKLEDMKEEVTRQAKDEAFVQVFSELYQQLDEVLNDDGLVVPEELIDPVAEDILMEYEIDAIKAKVRGRRENEERKKYENWLRMVG